MIIHHTINKGRRIRVLWITTEIQYMIGSIVGKFQLKILMAEAAPKNVCSQKQVFGQTILEQPLPKNLKAEISNTILRLFIY